MKTFRQGDAVEGFAKYRKTTTAEALRMDEPFCVETIEGTMTAKAGDYLMRGVFGELYPCDAEIFERTYEPYDAEDPA